MKKRTGSIINRDGYLHLRYIIEGCQFQFPLKTKSLTEAKKLRGAFMSNRQGGLNQYEAYLKGELERIRRFRSDDSSCTFLISEVWEAFTRSPKRPRAGASSLLNYKPAWDQFAEALDSKKKRIGQVSKQDAHDRMEAIFESGLRQSTAERHLIYLTAIFKALLPDGAANPFQGCVARGAEGGDDLSSIPVTLDQARTLLASTGRKKGERIKPQESVELYGVFATMAYTGLRLGDAVSLTIEEIHFDRKILNIRVNKTSRRKKGKAAYAKIGLHPALHAVLLEQIGDRDSGPVFPGINGWNSNRQSGNIQRVFCAAGVERRVQAASGMKNLYGSSSFRHALEDRLREAKVPQATINVILCHSDKSMAATYSTITDAEVYDAIISAMPDIRPAAGRFYK